MTTERHWPEYAIEGALLALFMMAACAFAALLEHPASSLRQVLPYPVLRRVLMGLAIGATAVTLVRSPWGQQSGAHMNPSLTFAYWRLGKVASADALGYVLSQFVGGATGIAAVRTILGSVVSHPQCTTSSPLPVRWVSERPSWPSWRSRPGSWGSCWLCRTTAAGRT